MNKRSAIAAINEQGIILVFPINNRKEPNSLWNYFHPRTAMRWEWDAGGDDRVPELWHLREELSRSSKVVYTKWFRGRATFFSREVFVAMLARFRHLAPPPAILTAEAVQLLEALDESSPLSTKALKKAADLQGKFNEPTYTKAMKELWSRLLVVGFGEIDDGAFPSLAMGSTRLMFEDLWKESESISENEIDGRLKPVLLRSVLFQKYYHSILHTLAGDIPPDLKTPSNRSLRKNPDQGRSD